jgi:hypothetical protein
VLLPAPFSPSSAWNVPGRTLIDIVERAKSPNRMVSARRRRQRAVTLSG